MPLVPISTLIAAAQAGQYSLGYFESWNLESLQGTIEAAEITRSPIIIGFNGEFLTHTHRLPVEPIALWAALGRAAAEAAAVPCGLIFNECADDAALRQAVDTGFNLVMLADPGAFYEDYEQRVRSLVQYAHPWGTAVEAELGELPSGLLGEDAAHNASETDPELATRFARATGVDLLSVSVGNVHVLVNGERPLNFDLLARLSQKTGIPLGLHGGTGIPINDLRAVGRYGVVKVNFGTYLKQRYLAAVRQALNSSEVNPHKLLGMGGEEDVMSAGRRAVRDAILERIEALGCCGRA
jgi:fructose/tagatose bisphosphate aldolase